MTAPTTGFLGWIQAYGQILLFFSQLLFWLAIAVAAVWSTLLFRKLVHERTAPTEAAMAPAEPAVDSEKKPSVDDFVD
jgi:hypothetical protein